MSNVPPAFVAAVRANLARLDGCASLHGFEVTPETASRQLGRRYRCAR